MAPANSDVALKCKRRPIGRRLLLLVETGLKPGREVVEIDAANIGTNLHWWFVISKFCTR